MSHRTTTVGYYNLLRRGNLGGSPEPLDLSIHGNSVCSHLKYTRRQNKNLKVKQRGRGCKGNPKVPRWVKVLGLHGRVVMETAAGSVVMETTARTPTKVASKLFLDPLVIIGGSLLGEGTGS